MAKHERWNLALEEDLERPFPDEVVQTLSKGGTEIDYVSWRHYVYRLNELVGADGWEMGDPVVTEAGGRLVIGLPITILGKTRVNFGDESEEKDSFGTPSTNAFAQAFKRTCALFGLGLYLYEKEAPKTYSGLATGKQREYIDRLMDERKLTDQQISWVLDRLTDDLTKEGASKIIENLEQRPKKNGEQTPF